MSLFFYGLGGMLLSLFSITILQIIPISKKKKFKWLHKTTAKLVTAVLYTNPMVKKKVINTINELFEKPAIIISNHSSSLDTLSMGLITHNIIYLVNDWVYKSPIFGVLARVLGFYPVTDGIDNSSKHLQEKINQGYLLVVFPEAKRSLTNKIGRFHKGAFFLQTQLKTDILPIYLHGNSEVMPKNDFMIHDGSLTMKIGERIAYDDVSFGVNDRERTKKISKFYKQEFTRLRTVVETAPYFKEILFSNYRYKSPEILKQVKSDFKLYKEQYHELNNLLNMKCKLLHINNDLGQIDILLVSKSVDRKITSYNTGTSRRVIAENCYVSKHKKVKFINRICDVDLSNNDTLLVSTQNGIDILKQINLVSFKSIILFNKKNHSVEVLNSSYEKPLSFKEISVRTIWK